MSLYKLGDLAACCRAALWFELLVVSLMAMAWTN